MEKKELRCPDCDYVLIDKYGKETNVLLALEGNGTRYGLCKKCGSFVFAECEEEKIYAEDGMDAITYIILAAIVSGLLDEKGMKLEEIIKEYNEKEKEEKEIKNSSPKDVFDSSDEKEGTGEYLSDLIKSITRPTETVKFDDKSLRKIPDFDEDCLLKYKYILLSKGHDSWKIFDSKEELLKELSVINRLEDVLIYTLGKECKVKREINLV